MKVIKRDGSIKDFSINKVIRAVSLAFDSLGQKMPTYLVSVLKSSFNSLETESISVENIQDAIEDILINDKQFSVAKAYILYRENHKNLRFIKERAEYIETYSTSTENAASSSETDANANIQNKNVATLEAELYKPNNIDLSRYRVTKKLAQMYGSNAPDYIRDLKSRVIYKHDEGSAAAIKPYCVAVSLYPFLQKGTASLDKSRATPPNNIRSFCGQFGNLVFLLSSQFQGAVAFGEMFIAFNYYCVKEWGGSYYSCDSEVVYHSINRSRTISDEIEQAFQDITHTINQPAGNRSFQSPFTNVSYYDSNYWEALFKDFLYPDGTKPEWKAINYLQKKYMRWFNKERTKTLLTFPVETLAMLSDKHDIIDRDYKNFAAEMYAKGHSFFTYISDKADSLSSCCRLRNKMDKNEFSFTNGLTGVATGSKSVITINLSRLVQNWVYKVDNADRKAGFISPNCFRWKAHSEEIISGIKDELISVLSRVYMYHSAYNELLWDLYDRSMLPVYSEGYINLNQQFLTIGINGLNEAAEYFGIIVSDNPEYEAFCNLITTTISTQNRIAEAYPYNPLHKIKINTECVPAENLALKNYNWDKSDGYWVPEDRNLYNSYFYKPEDPTISILEKFRLHGNRYAGNLDGGVACHINLEEHLSKEQYLKLIEYAVKQDTTYFTFNVPNSQCEDCGYISKQMIDTCPICQSTNITLWTRIIGYLRPIKGFSKGRREEAAKRVYLAINSIDA